MSDIYVYDEDFVTLGIVEDVISLQWLSEYAGEGEIKLIAYATDKNLDLLKKGYRLYTPEHVEAAYIYEIEINDNGRLPDITVRAKSSVARWKDRVVMATENITNVEAAMLGLTAKHRRGLSGITAVAKGYTESLDMQITWNSVLEAEEELAGLSGLGFREAFDPDTGEEKFEVYKGTDRTSGEGYVGYFSEGVNVESSKITDSSAEYKNVAVVGGQGEGMDRKVIIVSDSAYEAEERRELWVDAKDLSQTYQIATATGETDSDGNPRYDYTEGTYSDAEYTEMLRARGFEKLSEVPPELSIEINVNQDLMQYGRDYHLGDVMPYKSKYGYDAKMRVTAVKITEESTGRTLTVQLRKE